MSKWLAILLLLILAAAMFAGWVALRGNLSASRSVEKLALAAYRGDATAANRIREAGPASVPALISLMQSRTPAYHRWVSSVRCYMPGMMQPMVERSLGTPAGEKRLAAIRALGLLGPDAVNAVPALARVMNTDSSMHFEATRVLSGIGTNALPELRNAAAGPNQRARHAAVYAIGQMGPAAAGAVPELVRTVEEGEELARSSAAYALTLVGPEGIAAIRRLRSQSNTNEVSRLAAAAAAAVNPGAFYQAGTR